MQIGDRLIDLNNPTYFIAEIGANFDKKLERAKGLIWLAKESKADAVKFQHYTADTLVSNYGFSNLKNNTHQSTWKQSVYETYKQAELNLEWTSILAEEANKAKIDFFTSPYAYYLADYVDRFVPAFKIGSGDITWLAYLDYVASKGKPVFLATGASTQDEVDRAVQTVLTKTDQLVLMQCNTNYSGDPDNSKFMNLRVLTTFANRYPNIALGLSDHSVSVASVLGAIALGARVIERHFTDDTHREGPDHPFSTDPNSWRQMIQRSRELEDMLGDGIKRVENNEQDARIVQRRSICAKNNLNKGQTLTIADFDYLRPCSQNSFAPSEATKLIGKKLSKGMEKGEAFIKSFLV